MSDKKTVSIASVSVNDCLAAKMIGCDHSPHEPSEIERQFATRSTPLPGGPVVITESTPTGQHVFVEALFCTPDPVMCEMCGGQCVGDCKDPAYT